MGLTGKIGNLLVSLGLDTAQFEQGFANAQKTLSRATGQMESLGKTLSLKVTAPLVGIGVAALKASVDFNEAMGKVATLIPGNIDRVKELKSGIQDLAIKTGKSTQDLAGGLYHVISAFQDTGDSIKILGIVSKAASAGLGSMEDSLRHVSSVTKAWGDTSTAAIQKMADFGQQVIKLGQTTLPELTQGIQKVAPVFKVMGGTLQEMYAAFATFSGVTGPAEKVGTQLGALVSSFLAPSREMLKLFQTLGVTTGPAFIRAAGGMSEAVKLVVQAAQDSETPLKSFLGRKEAITLALVWAGTQAETYSQRLKEMGEAEGEAGRAAAERAEGINKFGRSLAILNQKLTVVRQNLGDAITQALAGDAAETGSSWMDRLVTLSDAFAKADPAVQQFVVGMTAAFAIGGPVFLAVAGFVKFISFAFGAGGIIAAALLVTAGVIAGLVLVFRDTYNALSNLGTDFSNAWKNLCEGLAWIWEGIWNRVSAFFITKLEWLKVAAQGFADSITAIFEKLAGDMVYHSIVPDMMNAMVANVDAGYNRMQQSTRRATETFTNAWADVGRTFMGSLKNMLKQGEFDLEEFANRVGDIFWHILEDIVAFGIKSLLGGLMGGFGGGFGGFGFEHGGVIPMAQGAVLRGPTLIPMRRGLGLAGEAGPEGVFPLARVGGDLGVRATGLGEFKITMINQSPTPLKGRAQMGGDRELIIMMDEVGEQLVESGGRMAKALDRRYNASPVTVVR